MNVNDSAPALPIGLFHNPGHRKGLAVRKRYDLVLDQRRSSFDVEVRAVTVWRPKGVLMTHGAEFRAFSCYQFVTKRPLSQSSPRPWGKRKPLFQGPF